MAIVFAELFLFRGDKTGDETEVSRLSYNLFQKNPKVLICHSSLFSAAKTVTVSTTLKFSTLISSADLTD